MGQTCRPRGRLIRISDGVCSVGKGSQCPSVPSASTLTNHSLMMMEKCCHFPLYFSIFSPPKKCLTFCTLTRRLLLQHQPHHVAHSYHPHLAIGDVLCAETSSRWGIWLLQVVAVVVEYKLKRLRAEKSTGTPVAPQNSEAFATRLTSGIETMSSRPAGVNKHVFTGVSAASRRC